MKLCLFFSFFLDARGSWITAWNLELLQKYVFSVFVKEVVLHDME